MNFILSNDNQSLNDDDKVSVFHLTRCLMVCGVGLMMLLSTSGSLLVETETESPLKESQEEREGESEEIFVRNSHYSKLQKILPCSEMMQIIVTPPQSCYLHIIFIQGHQLKHDLAAPLLC